MAGDATGTIAWTSAAGAKGRPRRLRRDVHEPVPDLAVDRRTENDVQLRRLVGVVERGVHLIGVDEDRVAWPERRRLPVEPLLDLTGPDDDHLLLTGMPVEVVRLSGLERHVHHDELLRAGTTGRAAPADHAPVEVLAADLGLPDERAHHVPFPVAIALKRRMFSVIAVSVGSRSIEDAPKNPTTPSVLSRMYAASSGSEIGPPWHRTRICGLTAAAASRIAWIGGTHSSSVLAVSAPIAPPVVSPLCGTRTSAPASALAAASSTEKT